MGDRTANRTFRSQEIYRKHAGPLADGGCRELATAYHKLGRDLPRDKD